MSSLRLFLLALVVLLLPVAGGAIGFRLGTDWNASSSAGDGAQGGDFGLLREIYDTLRANYVDPDKIDPELLRSGAIDGLLQALGDPHTIYIDPQSYSLGVDVISGTFEGIGARVEQDPITRAIVIVTPFRGSPAERAGIQPGDVILAVNGERTEGWTLTQAVQRIRGPRGSQVTLTLQRRDGTVREVTLTRDTVVVPTVVTQPVTDDSGATLQELAYVELQQFTEQTPSDLARVLREVKQSGARGLILDLRRNPGGSLEATIRVADLFLDSGTILTEVERGGRQRQVRAQPGGDATDLPMVVLVGPGSASGAEVLAAALKENQRAVLIGEKTFGKGTVNQIHELSNGGALFVTVGRWLTPNGELIEGVGIEPDVPVPGMTEQLAQGHDPALPLAVQHLRQALALAR